MQTATMHCTRLPRLGGTTPARCVARRPVVALAARPTNRLDRPRPSSAKHTAVLPARPARPTTTTAGRAAPAGGAAATTPSSIQSLIPAPGGAVPGFDTPPGSAPASFRLAILGDLHLDEPTRPAFDEAAAQLRRLLLDGVDGTKTATSASVHPRLIQLGDLGASSFSPGSAACFAAARAYLDEHIGVPRALVTGNHDLESPTFDAPGDVSGEVSDAANLAAWRSAFNQPHAWSASLGPARVLGISTTAWRANAASVHEVRVDEAQLAWLEAEVAATPPATPIIVVSHAPPAGCGLRVVQDVHVRNRCAYLNHTDPTAAARFVALVEAHPNICLWFSGHYHLSHQYASSISVVRNCAFVQVGVIGPKSSRDGYRQSRLLEADAAGFRLYSVDHGAGGTARLDLERGWGADAGPPRPRPVPRAERLDAASLDRGWLASEVECAVPGTDGGYDSAGSDSDGSGPAARPAVLRASPVTWLAAGGDALLALSPLTGAVVEYSVTLRSPTGVVMEGLPPWTDLVLVGADGAALPPDAPESAARAAVAVEARARADGALLGRAERNACGGFYRTFQVNKWRKAKREAAEAAQQQAAGVRG
jgi:hypothetical protein